jgi:RNA polymerase sigma-70 factor, ECF subfamily
VLNLTFAGDRIAAIDVVADQDQLKALDLSTLP